jgi:SAM-dependent methyltransferase
VLAERYARSRPRYPAELFRFVASVAPATSRAWDCATGSGQAALGLAEHFEHVEATDASAGQVASAHPHPRVHYSVQPAESTSFADASFDAITVAQALHWFDLDRFYAEARRVLRDCGVLIATGYDHMHVTDAFDAEFKRVVLKPVAEWWPKQNAKLWRGYREIPFPLEPIEVPPLRIESDWSLDDAMAYVGTWSAVQRRSDADPGFLDAAKRELEPHWPGGRARITMALHARCGRHRR